jgi:heme/copper-type cytochrome/quinol oxidase subunit 2
MEENQSLLELQVDREASTNLMEVSRWGKFLGLLILIGVGLVIILCLFLWGRMARTLIPADEIDSSSRSLMQIILIGALVIAGAVVGILMSFLIKAGTRIRLGIQNRDQLLFNSGLASLKNYFTMYGVIAIIGLFFSLIALLIN